MTKYLVFWTEDDTPNWVSGPVEYKGTLLNIITLRLTAISMTKFNANKKALPPGGPESFLNFSLT